MNTVVKADDIFSNGNIRDQREKQNAEVYMR